MNADDQLTATKSIQLQAPPLVLVHGIWSDGQAWAGLETYLKPLYGTAGIYRVDYSQSYSKSFTDPATQYALLWGFSGGHGINDALAAARHGGTIATRVDVVAHSMGGLVTRAYAASPNYLADENYHKGSVYRLITVGTPHTGTELAQWLLDRRSRVPDAGTFFWLKGPFTTLAQTFAAMDKDVTAGGVASLAPGSPALQSLAPFAVLPYQAILGNAPGNSTVEYILNTIAADFDGIPFGSPQDSINGVLGGLNNDALVDVLSQKGTATTSVGIAGITHFSLFPPNLQLSLPVVPDETHSVTVNRSILCWLSANWLCSSLGVPTQRQSVSPTRSRTVVPLADLDFSAMTPVPGSVLAVAPDPAAALPVGSQATVTVSCSTKTLTRAIFDVAGYIQDVTSVPFVLAFTPTSTDSVAVGITALFDDNTYARQVVEYAVAQPAAPVFIQLTPPAPVLYDLGKSLSLAATVRYENGSQLDVTAGATYSIREPLGVVIVSPSGVLTSIGSGYATVDVVYGSLKGSVLVKVLPGAPPDVSACTAPITAPAAVCAMSSSNTASVPDAGPGAVYAWSIVNGTITDGADTQTVMFTAGPTGAVVLQVAVMNASACLGSDSKVIQVGPSPTISAVASVCASSMANSATVPDAGSGATYSWSITNGVIQSGGGTSRIRFSVGSSGSVELSCTVTNANGCTVMSAPFDIVIGSCSAEPQAILVDTSANGVLSDGNGILDPGETVVVSPTWKNIGGTPLALSGTASSFIGSPGATYTITDSSADYGSVASGATSSCSTTSNCYALSVSNPAIRPATHWDAALTETLSDADAPKLWPIHIGQSFTDVPRSYVFYPFVERILHNGVTTGCTPTTYCPDATIFRLQMAIFIARAQAGGDANVPVSGTAQGNPYNCTNGGISQFTDIDPTNPFCRHVHYIFSTGVTTGCITTPPRQYCPNDNVSRGQMALFIARAVAGSDAAVPVTYGPDPVTGRSYSCNSGSPNLHFTDITTSDIYCRHTHYLWAKNVISGFPDNSYGPGLNVSRGAMAKFLANGFNLQLYGP